jgi:hypothetical protein
VAVDAPVEFDPFSDEYFDDPYDLYRISYGCQGAVWRRCDATRQDMKGPLTMTRASSY